MHRQQKWPADVTSRLVALHNEGLSFDAIAERLREETGLPYNRDMVAGKIGRLALPQRPIQLVRTGLPDVAVTIGGYLLKISIAPVTAKKKRRYTRVPKSEEVAA